MFSSSKIKKRVNEVIPQYQDVILQWGVNPKVALDWATKFATKAASNTKQNSLGFKEDVNLADLYFSGEEPKTPYGRLWLPIIHKYEPQRNLDEVSPTDIYWYWSMPMLEREFLLQMIAAYRTGLSLAVMQSKDWASTADMWLTVEREVARNTVNYGLIAPEDIDETNPERPLSFELYARIERFRGNPFSPDVKKRLVELDNHNSFIRELIKTGLV